MSMQTIRCPKCAGKGEVEMPEEYTSVLAVIPKAGATTERVSEKLMIEFTTASMRLNRMVELGLLTRSRTMRGKPYVYQKKETK